MSDDLVRDALAAYRTKTAQPQQPPEPATPPSPEPGTTTPGKMPAGPRGGTSPSSDFVRDTLRRRARR